MKPNNLENPEKSIEHRNKRRERKLQINENYTSEDIKYTFSLFKNTCFNCGEVENLCIDHHYPLSKGYGLSRDNAVILCRSCNSSKSNKMPEDFYNEEKLSILVNEYEIRRI